jgi:hypothetical protein
MALLQEQLHRIDVDPRVWFASATVKLDRLRQVERRVSADIIATSATLEANARRHALLYSGLLAATVVLAIGLSLVTARSLRNSRPGSWSWTSWPHICGATPRA